MPMQRTFSGGEIAPAVYGGADRQRYNEALATCRNFIIMRGGGAANRQGSAFIEEVKDSSSETYLLPFIFDDTDTYVIEAGNLYFRFYREGGQVIVSGVSAWSSSTAYVVGDLVVVSGVNYYCILGNTNETPVNATYWYALTGNILEVPTPYAAADLPLLKVEQSGDVITLTHNLYPPMELKRYPTLWTLSTISTVPSIAAPTSGAGSAGAVGTATMNYQVTAAATTTYEESLPSATIVIASCVSPPTAAAPNTLTWDAVAGAAEYYVYCDNDGNGIFGFIGIGATNAFNDVGYQPDFSTTPPINQALFVNTGDYPVCSTHFQQRLVMGGSDNNPETVDASRSGSFKNFTISSPIQDDDAVEFTIAGRRVAEVRHMLEVGHLIILTASSEWAVAGDTNGVLSPTAINLLLQGEQGASDTVPVIIGKNLLYVQARGGIVRDLEYTASAYPGTVGTYEGRDLTVYATHLFEGFSIDRLDYAQTPNSIMWAVRSDGVLLGLTYLKEFEVYAWHHHDTLGLYEDVCVVPETTTPIPGGVARGKEEDAVYVIVNRTINGDTRRYVERFASRFVTDYRLDACFLDSFLTYNGINTGPITMTLSTAGAWTTTDTITITASAPFFAAGDVGARMALWIPGGAVLDGIVVLAYSSSTVVSGKPIIAVPLGLQSTATTVWSKAVMALSGLDHLDGETVSALGTGQPLGTFVVSSGAITLLAPYHVIQVGLPIVADFESLDLDDDQQVIRDKRKLVNMVSVLVEQSNGFLAGPDVNHLTQSPSPPPSTSTNPFDGSQLAPTTGIVELPIDATWEQPGRIFIRMTDPLPLKILAIIPNVGMGG